MAIEERLALIPPPRTTAAGVADWATIERAIDTHLPSDYGDFARHYGGGRFDDGSYAFRVFNPLAPDYPARLNEELDLWRARRAWSPWEYPADIFPAANGCSRWGGTRTVG